MISKSKKTLCVLLLTISVMLGYFIWLSLHPVDIIAIHQRNNYSDVLVRNFPFTDKGKINWWMDNKEMLKDKYSIPKPARDGFYTVIFWDFGEGYKEEGKYDRLCFYDMKTNKNCIDKNSLIIIKNNKNNITSFVLDSGIYQLKNDDIVKIESD